MECFSCGSSYVHLRDVYVVARNGEDNDYGLCMNIDIHNAKFKCDTEIKDNISRRDATILTFSCEECSELSALKFVQRKGFTCIE